MFLGPLFLIASVVLGVGYNYYSNKLKDLKEKTQIASIDSAAFKFRIVDDTTKKTVKQESKEGKQIQLKDGLVQEKKIYDNPKKAKIEITQNGKNNLVVQGDNKGNINVGDTYNSKPPQRHVEDQDLKKILEKAVSKDTIIKVSSNGSTESDKFRNEILNALSKMGYKKLTTVSVGMSQNYFGEGRLTIRPAQYGKETWIEVIVNPQE